MLASSDRRVQAIRHESNRGNIATFNEGLLEWADGEYSVLISADDLLVEGALARAVAVMEKHPSVGLVYGHAINWVDNRPLPKARTVCTGIRLWKGHDWIRTICRLGHNVITTPEVVVRTRIQKTVGGYRPKLKHAGDMELWLRFAAHSDVAYVEGADQAYYRIHGNNMTVARSPLIDLQQRAEVFRSFFADPACSVPDADELSGIARRAVAKEALWLARRAYEKRRFHELPSAQLKQLAYDTYPESRSSIENWGLRWSEMVGPSMAPYLQILAPLGVHRKIRHKLWWRRWRLKGY
jgi:glycosyltransferase involved in cell wall biosynthesis